MSVIGFMPAPVGKRLAVKRPVAQAIRPACPMHLAVPPPRHLMGFAVPWRISTDRAPAALSKNCVSPGLCCLPGTVVDGGICCLLGQYNAFGQCCNVGTTFCGLLMSCCPGRFEVFNDGVRCVSTQDGYTKLLGVSGDLFQAAADCTLQPVFGASCAQDCCFYEKQFSANLASRTLQGIA